MQEPPKDSSSDCQRFFEQLDLECVANGSAAIRGERLRAQAKDRKERLIEWERMVASKHSPGQIGDTETIRKALFDGCEIVEGCLHRNSFSPLVDLGLSADRIAFASNEEIKARFEALGSKRNRRLVGYIDLSVQHMRGMTCRESDDKPVQRAIGVYDTAESANTSHAEAFLLCKFSNSKPIKSVQQDLCDLYRNTVVNYS